MLDDVADPKRRCLELGKAERFEQIIHGMDAKPFQSVFRIGRRENHQRRVLQRTDKIHSGKIGHVDIHIEDIHLLHIRPGGRGRRAGSHEFQERDPRHIRLHLPERQGFVIHNRHPDHERAASIGQNCWSAGTVKANTAYALYDGDGKVLGAFKTPSTGNLSLIVSGPDLESVKYGVTVDGGTPLFDGLFTSGATVSGGSGCTLSTYTGGSGMGGGGGRPGWGW